MFVHRVDRFGSTGRGTSTVSDLDRPYGGFHSSPVLDALDEVPRDGSLEHPARCASLGAHRVLDETFGQRYNILASRMQINKRRCPVAKHNDFHYQSFRAYQ